MLTKDDIQSIHKWTKIQGVEYYDVQLEIVDHLATSIETQISKDPSQSLQAVFDKEILYWSKDKITELIKEKKHHLYWSWFRRLGAYCINYLKLPKVLILIVLTALISWPILYSSYPLETLEKIVVYALIIYGISGIHWYCKNIAPLSLITAHAYFQIMPGIPIFLSLIFQSVLTMNFEVGLYPKVIFLSFLLSLSIILLHALFFVFPKQLKEDTMKYYKHLTIS